MPRADERSSGGAIAGLRQPALQRCRQPIADPENPSLTKPIVDESPVHALVLGRWESLLGTSGPTVQAVALWDTRMENRPMKGHYRIQHAGSSRA